MSDINNLISNYKKVRQKTINIANMFDQDDQLDQSMKDASPIIWHLGHTSWFFDNFILKHMTKIIKKLLRNIIFSLILITSLQVKCFQEIEEVVILHYH